MRYVMAAVAVLAMSGVVACGGGKGNPVENQDGRIRLSITDAPVDDATSVVIQFSGVAFKRVGAAAEVIRDLTPAVRQIDLLKYQQGQAALLLEGVTLPAGQYEWVRLMVDNQFGVRDSYIVRTTGEECELRVPSGAESGLKLNRGFTLAADGSVALTIDFDLRKSIHAPPGQRGATPDCSQGYLMRPTLRIVDDANVGAIAGSVDSALITADCLPKVYVFPGADVVPDDIEEQVATPDIDPLLVANVELRDGAAAYGYRAAFIPPGTYTLAFTCSDDDATADDVLTFLSAKNVTVQANLIGSVDFLPPAAP